MKIAYADPPYIGQARKHYGKETICKEVNHSVLVGFLCENFDSWALSLSTPSLQQIIALCPPDVRVGAWVKPFCSFKPGVNPAYAWEPIIYWHPRKKDRYQPTIRDFVSANITLKKGLSGAKPPAFCYWLFDLLGVQEEDEFTDIFPGTGIVSEALSTYREEKKKLKTA